MEIHTSSVTHSPGTYWPAQPLRRLRAGSAFMERMHQETTAILEGLQPEDLGRKCTSPEGTSITTWKLLRSMIEHEVHHRGEIYVCLALRGVPRPPLFGLRSEELIKRSAITA